MFYTDKPITSNQEDLFSRSNFAKLLARSIVNLHTTDTFTMGLYSKWGSGKTSLLNMMVQEIEENQKNLDNSEKLTVVDRPY